MSKKDDQYARIVEKYDKQMIKQSSRFDKDFINIGNIKNPAGWNILNIGCGTGIGTLYMLEKFPQINKIVGIDISRKMIEFTKKRIRDKRVEFLVEDMHRLSFPKETFDFIYAKFSVHYSNNLKQLFTSINKVTKPGGIFLFRDTHPLVGFFRKESKSYKNKETVDFPVSGGSDIIVKHPTFTIEEYINTAVQTGWGITKLIEEEGVSSKRLGIEGFKIPTMIVIKLKKQ